MRSVEVYHVQYAFRADASAKRWVPLVSGCRSLDEADQLARSKRNDPRHYACVKVTGPHAQQVPE